MNYNEASSDYSEVWRRVFNEPKCASEPECASEPIYASEPKYTLKSDCAFESKCEYGPKTERVREYDVAEKLEAFMDDEARDYRFYTRLAGKTYGRARRCLLSMAADEAAHMKKLEAEYFIVTGGCYKPVRSAVHTSCVMESLREQYSHELYEYTEYEEAAALCCDARRAELFHELAWNEKRHSCMIVNILSAAMC